MALALRRPATAGSADRTRQDRRVVRPAALVADQGGDPLPVELPDERRRELVRDQHERPFDVAEQIRRILRRAQVPAQSRDDVRHVPFALAQVGIVRRGRTATRSP